MILQGAQLSFYGNLWLYRDEREDFIYYNARGEIKEIVSGPSTLSNVLDDETFLRGVFWIDNDGQAHRVVQHKYTYSGRDRTCDSAWFEFEQWATALPK